LTDYKLPGYTITQECISTY